MNKLFFIASFLLLSQVIFSQPSQKILDKVEKSTVFIHLDFVIISASGVQLMTSMGSGFLVSEDGYIITNAHVVNQNNIINNIIVRLENSSSYNADLIRMDFDYDLALLKLNTNQKFDNYLSISKDVDIKDGSEVNFIGYPLPVDFQKQLISPKASISKGLIKRKNQKTNISKSDMDIFEISCDANHGNSGGPCFNYKTGEVIGVITKRLSDQSTGISFAVPAKYISSLYAFNSSQNSHSSLMETDVIELLHSMVNELEENKAKIDWNSSIFKGNIALKDSGKILVANPVFLDNIVWDNAKINKINILEKLQPAAINFLRTIYIQIANYNELVKSRNTFLNTSQALSNYRERLYENDKNLLDSGISDIMWLDSCITYLKNLLQ